MKHLIWFIALAGAVYAESLYFQKKYEPQVAQAQDSLDKSQAQAKSLADQLDADKATLAALAQKADEAGKALEAARIANEAALRKLRADLAASQAQVRAGQASTSNAATLAAPVPETNAAPGEGSASAPSPSSDDAAKKAARTARLAEVQQELATFDARRQQWLDANVVTKAKKGQVTKPMPENLSQDYRAALETELFGLQSAAP